MTKIIEDINGNFFFMAAIFCLKHTTSDQNINGTLKINFKQKKANNVKIKVWI